MHEASHLVSVDLTFLGHKLAVREDGVVFKHSYVDKANKFRKSKRLDPHYKAGRAILSFRVGKAIVSRYLYQIVCEAFHGPCPEHIVDKTTDHIDGNIHNNHFTNLQWLSRSDNSKKYYAGLTEEEVAAMSKRRSDVMFARHAVKDPSLPHYRNTVSTASWSNNEVWSDSSSI